MVKATFQERQEYLAEMLENIAASLAIHPEDFELFPTQGNLNQVRNAQHFLRNCAEEIHNVLATRRKLGVDSSKG